MRAAALIAVTVALVAAAAARSAPVPFDRPSRVGHPSLPNYIALLGGSTYEIRSDCNGCDVEAHSLVGQLDAAGLSWKAYFEDLTSNRRPGARTAEYTPHYNPFVYYDGTSAPRSRSASGGARAHSWSRLWSRRPITPFGIGARRPCRR